MNGRQLVSVCLISFFLISCHKSQNEIVQLHAAKKGLKERAIDFMMAKKKKVGEAAKASIEQLIVNVDWADFSESKQPFFNGIQTAFRVKNEIFSSKDEEATYTCLYVIQNSDGNIVNVSTLEVSIPETNAGNLNTLALNLVNNNMQGYTGTLTKRNLSGYYIYEIEIVNGNAGLFRYLKKGNTGGKHGLYSLTETCVDWYWQTYVNGVLVSEIFLFTDCGQNVEEGGSGNGGVGGQTVYNPCDEVNSLVSDAWFRDSLSILRNKYNDPSEHAYTFTGSPGGGGYSLQHFQGIPGNGVNPTVNVMINGIMHNHNQAEPFSIFSPDDLRFMYEIYQNGNASADFSFTLVTNNTAYILKVDDVNAFLQFGNQNFSDQVSFINFSFITYAQFGMNEINSPNLNENGFLRMLKFNNTGLKLFSASADLQNWEMKGLDVNNNTIPVNCN